MRVIALFVVVCAAVCAAKLVTIDNSVRTMIYDRQRAPNEWRLAGFALPTDTIFFVMGLKQRNLDVLERKFWAVSTPGSAEYQKFMTYPEIMKIISPTEVNRQTVFNWLLDMGVPKENIRDRGDNFGVTVSVALASKMFDTQFYRFVHVQNRQRGIIRQLGSYSLPTALWMNIVDIVAGISDFPALMKNPHLNSAPKQGSPGVIPAVLAAQYNIPSSASASNTTQGVIEFGSGEYFAPSDLQEFAKQVGQTIAPLTSNHIHNPLPPVGIEGTLDIQYISAIGVNSVNWYWTDSDWLYEWGTSFSAATSKPEIVSVSYGWSELAQCDIDPTGCQQLGVSSEGYVSKVNTEFQKIGLQGVSILCASGDSGANGRTDPDCTASQLRPAYPGVSPYVTAVGATQLTSPPTPISNQPPVCSSGEYACNYGGQETAVSFDVASFTSGGGFSNYSPRPSYQDAAVSAYFTSGVQLPPQAMWNKTNRGYPDVASIGTAILIYADSMGGIASVGGTSASSPSFAGYMSLVNQKVKAKTGKPLGFLNPFLYKMYASDASTFTDITVGDNICTEDGCASTCKGFYCAKGWDPVTGLGVANVANMLKYVALNF